MVVAVMMVTIAAMREPHRLQFDVGHAGRNVEPGLALHADRLQRIGILRTADQEIAAAADPDRGVGADAAVMPARSPRPTRLVGALTPRSGGCGR